MNCGFEPQISTSFPSSCINSFHQYKWWLQRTVLLWLSPDIQPHQVTFENVLGTWQRSQTHQTSVHLSTRVMQQNHAEISRGSEFCSSLITLWTTDVEILKLLAVVHWRTFWNCGTYMHTIHIMLAGNICLCSNDIDGENTGQMFRCFWAFYNSVVAPVLLEMCCWHKIQMFPKSWATKVYWFYTIFIWIEYQNKLGNQTFRFANVLNSVVPQFLINVWGIILFEYADFQDSE